MDELLELYIHPFGEVSHAAVDAADDGASLPFGFLVDLGGAVELGQSSGFFKAAFEVSCLRVRQRLLVGLDEMFKCFGGTVHLAVGFPVFKALVGGGIQEVVLEAALFVD